MTSTPSEERDWLAHPRSLVAPIYDHLGFAIHHTDVSWTLQVAPR